MEGQTDGQMNMQSLCKLKNNTQQPVITKMRKRHTFLNRDRVRDSYVERHKRGLHTGGVETGSMCSMFKAFDLMYLHIPSS